MENLTGLNSRSEFKLLSLLTGEIFGDSLKRNDIVSNEIVPTALAYLAAIHYAASEYTESTRLCSAVFMDQTSKHDNEALDSGCLLLVDDVAKPAGLCALQKKITESNLHYINRRPFLNLRLSP